ncbi:DUF2470 domain-containing protein [Thermobifida halotolerans]|uniref:DUF2470 domain-containing protein n=1 Tax=Thermobifida halotolerans TaxID=483545 RepID=A0A399G8E5_9ACTN|nr:DUF2470 domain-containing protein [Thermobifida halotolerans]UOE20200.1 DUF2470 domain-containing protein [Thermobifida halotolerans]
MSATPFPPEVVAAVTAHMNDDHPEDTLLIVRAFGGLPEATAARMTGLDGTAGEYSATVDAREVDVRIPWSRPLTERAQIRAEVVRLYREACARLGVAPRGEDGAHR